MDSRLLVFEVLLLGSNDTSGARNAQPRDALVGGEAGSVVPGDPRALRVLKLHPGDQVQKLDADIVDTLSMVNNS